MLSKISSHILSKTLVSQQAAAFSYIRKSLFNLFQKVDSQDPDYKIASFNPAFPLEKHQGIIYQDQAPTYKITKLSNGIRVLTESVTTPSTVDLGILIDAGTRDEDAETSGALLSIKNTYLKTVLNTNETVNYSMIQMAGGRFEMEYDQETTYFSANCLSHDVVDIFRMMTDCALEPKSVVAANVAQNKNKNTHKLEELIQTGEDFNNQIFRCAFKNDGLGMPMNGHKSNLPNLSAYVLQKFQHSHFLPQNIIVCAAGIQNHDEFLELAESELGGLTGGKERTREKSKYHGGHVRKLTEGNELNLALAWEGLNWENEDGLFDLLVLNTLLGDHANPNNRLRRLQKEKAYYDSVKSFNVNFSDNGLFGVQVSGPSGKGSEIVKELCDEIQKLRGPITEEEIQRAKSILINRILFTLERQRDRLEECARNVRSFGNVCWNTYAQKINKVNEKSLHKTIEKVMNSAPTFVAFGGDVNQIKGYDVIAKSLQK